MSRPVTIHPDGTGRGTVVLSEDGEQLSNITDISISITANGVAEATIEVKQTSINAKADVVEVLYHCPVCSTMMEHHCDEVMSSRRQPPLPGMGGASQSLQCESKLVERDPWRERRCIRGMNHPDSHFDGQRAWG